MPTWTAGKLLAVAAAALLAVAGCATVGPDIRSDYDETVDFSRFATFAFMDRAERDPARSYDTLGERRVMAAVRRELQARGYREVEADPDALHGGFPRGPLAASPEAYRPTCSLGKEPGVGDGRGGPRAPVALTTEGRRVVQSGAVRAALSLPRAWGG